MRRFLPKSFFGQTVLVLLIGLTVSHLVSMAIYSSDRMEILALSGGEETARRIASIARLVDQVPPEWRDRILETVQGPTLRVTLTGDSGLVPDASEGWRGGLIRRFLASEIPVAEDDVVVRLEGPPEPPRGQLGMMTGPLQRHMHMGWFAPAWSRIGRSGLASRFGALGTANGSTSERPFPTRRTCGRPRRCCPWS